MRVFKTKTFAKWASKEEVTDQTLLNAVKEIEAGLVEANLGSYLFKKRIAVSGRGKRSGARILVAYKASERTFFVYGFTKNKRGNIDTNELATLQAFAAAMISSEEVEITDALQDGRLIEIT